VYCVYDVCVAHLLTHGVTSHCSIHTVSIPLSPDSFQQGFLYSLTVCLYVCMCLSVSHCVQVCSCEAWRGKVFCLCQQCKFEQTCSIIKTGKAQVTQLRISLLCMFEWVCICARECFSVFMSQQCFKLET